MELFFSFFLGVCLYLVCTSVALKKYLVHSNFHAFTQCYYYYLFRVIVIENPSANFQYIIIIIIYFSFIFLVNESSRRHNAHCKMMRFRVKK